MAASVRLMRVAGLPFPFDVQGDPRSGGQATLAIHLDHPVPDERFDQLRCVVAWFAALGQSGTFAGDVLPVGQSRATLATGEPDARGRSPRWTFDAFSVDPASLTVLANLIFATGLNVRSVELTASGPTHPDVLPCDRFLTRPRHLAFAVDENRVDRNVGITIDFVADLPAPLADEISDLLRVWCLVAGLGGWRKPGPLRDTLDLSPEGDPEVVLDQLQLSVRDNGVHDGAYDALVALSHAVSQRGMPVARITVH
jgi:hypothetical protein